MSAFREALGRHLLAIEERDQFSSFLGDHGNSVPALVAHLKELTAQMRAGGPLPGQQQQ